MRSHLLLCAVMYTRHRVTYHGRLLGDIDQGYNLDMTDFKLACADQVCYHLSGVKISCRINVVLAQTLLTVSLVLVFTLILLS